MALNRSLPALLSPYLFPPEFSLCLITSVLGASSNWLVERWVVAGLASQSDRLRSGSEAGGQEERGAVVLVSFMREWEAWRDGVRRASGLDIANLAQQQRFAFVDGLTALFVPHASGPSGDGIRPPVAELMTPARDAGQVPARGRPANKGPTTSQTAGLPARPHGQDAGRFVLTSPSVDVIQSTISAAIDWVRDSRAGDMTVSQRRRITFIVDAPDILLATACLDLSLLLSTISEASRRVHTTVVSVAADPPLLSAATTSMHQATTDGDHGAGTVGASAFSPLEEQYAGLVASLAHRAACVMQLRRLETGWARDVSGVLSVSRGGGWEGCDDGGGGGGGLGEGEEGEKEVLYFVKGDGKVNVFERGSSS